MKTTSLIVSCVLLSASPLGLFAQMAPTNTTPGTTTTTSPGTGTTSTRYDGARTETRDTAGYSSDWQNDFAGPRAGDREFTLTGNGMSNKDMDNSSGGIGAALGFYLNDTLELVFRQTVNYVNPGNDGSSWAGSTRVALDQHLWASGRFRPFVGVNFGGVYGQDIEETFVGGIEAGVKFYVKPQTFLFVMGDYAWSFKDADDADDNFGDGGYQWSAGIGFNF